MTTPTQRFIEALRSLKAGDVGRLRQYAGLPLDTSVDGFDIFAGLWWPLRAKSQAAPRREVAWLIGKLYAFRPVPQAAGATLARQVGRHRPRDEKAGRRYQAKFDQLLLTPLARIETALQWALTRIGGEESNLDWVVLTNDLSLWEREETRTRWAREFLGLPG